MSTPAHDRPAIRTSSRYWGRFRRRLTEVLRGMEPDDVLILSHPATQHFVQFVGGGTLGLRAEVRSNHYNPSEHQLGPDQERRLIELGWKPPTHGPEGDRDPDGSSNWFRDFEHPVALDRLARMTELTFREVHGVRSPATLGYNAFETDGTVILLPSLRLRHLSRTRHEAPADPGTVGDLRRFVEQTLLTALDHISITRVKNGDLRTQSELGVVLLREIEDPLAILFYAVLPLELEESPAVLAILNELNRRLVLGRVSMAEGVIALEWCLTGRPFVADHLLQLLPKLHHLVPTLTARIEEVLGLEDHSPSWENPE